MRASALAWVVLLGAPSVVALGAAPEPGSTARVVDAAAPLPTGCVSDEGVYACHWNFDTRSDPGGLRPPTFDIPAFPKTLATIKVQLAGMDNGWVVAVSRTVTTSNSQTYSSPITSSRHAPDAAHPSYFHSDQTTHVFDDLHSRGDAGAFASSMRTTLTFTPYSADPNLDLGSASPRSEGKFDIYYRGEPVAAGVPHERPAATRNDPQLKGYAKDAPRAEVDLVAGWLDDAAPGDGLFDVHLAVVGNLTHIDWNATDSPYPVPATPVTRTGRSSQIDWNLHFKVQENEYYLKWTFTPTRDASTGTFQASHFQCALYRRAPPAPGAINPDAGDIVASNPSCAFSNDTLDAELPERSVGSPAPGAPFGELSANVDEYFEQVNAPVPRDTLNDPQFSFSLGGPAYWDVQNGCRFCPPPVDWWQQPLSSSNLPNTVQVGGAAVATAAFFVGLVLLRRRRAKVRALLREIEHVETQHERDTRAALLALGALDSRFADMYHKGALNDDQYQVVAQRLATAATRFALRQGLGLDDGAAGDHSLPREASAASSSAQGEQGAPIRIPVESGSAPPRRMHE